MQMLVCPKLYWSKKEGDRTIQFKGVPFSIEKLHCITVNMENTIGRISHVKISD